MDGGKYNLLTVREVFKMKRPTILGVVAPIMIGGLLYLLFRPTTIVIFDLLAKLGLNDTIEQLRISAQAIANKLPSWAIYNLPDGLWSFALCTAMLQHWKNKINNHSAFWVALAPLLGILFELLQKLGFIRGTFDLADIAAIMIGSSFSILIFTRNPKFSIP
jgi:hypothetical protein